MNKFVQVKHIDKRVSIDLKTMDAEVEETTAALDHRKEINVLKRKLEIEELKKKIKEINNNYDDDSE